MRLIGPRMKLDEFLFKGRKWGKTGGEMKEIRWVCPETYKIINIANICKHTWSWHVISHRLTSHRPLAELSFQSHWWSYQYCILIWQCVPGLHIQWFQHLYLGQDISLPDNPNRTFECSSFSSCGEYITTRSTTGLSSTRMSKYSHLILHHFKNYKLAS